MKLQIVGRYNRPFLLNLSIVKVMNELNQINNMNRYKLVKTFIPDQNQRNFVHKYRCD